MSMQTINLIPAKYRDARRRQKRARAWFTICGGYAVILAVAYVGVATALGDGGNGAADLAKTRQQTDELNRAAGMLKIQLRDAQSKLGVARTVGDQPDWSLLLAVLGKVTDEHRNRASPIPIVLRGCHLESSPDASGRPAPAANAKASTQPSPITPTKISLTVSGLGRSQSDVTQFVLRLEKLGLFDRVDLAQSAREPIGTTEATGFRIECTMHSRTGGEK
jgi:Tfp pilus assembly protein PilN